VQRGALSLNTSPPSAAVLESCSSCSRILCIFALPRSRTRRQTCAGPRGYRTAAASSAAAGTGRTGGPRPVTSIPANSTLRAIRPGAHSRDYGPDPDHDVTQWQRPWARTRRISVFHVRSLLRPAVDPCCLFNRSLSITVSDEVGVVLLPMASTNRIDDRAPCSVSSPPHRSATASGRDYRVGSPRPRRAVPPTPAPAIRLTPSIRRSSR
jgi:hypothetical protein